MSAMTTGADVVPIHRMTEEQYKRERAEITATYGESSVEAAARRDQAMAKLFYRSGWTQEQLAKMEGKSRVWVTVRLRFGSFLNFVTGVTKSESITFKLTEGRFRDYWKLTDQNQNEGQRFIDVVRKLQQSTPAAPRRNGLGRKIVDEFGDGKWHKIETIAKRVGEPPEALSVLLGNFNARHNNYGVALCEKRKVGAKDGTWDYRIVKGGQKIDLTALTQELLPILKELETQGKQHRASCSPTTVLSCVHGIRKLLEALTTEAAPSR